MKTTSPPRDWFRSWFDERYLFVYRHRDDEEAAHFVENWPVWNILPPRPLALDLGCGSGRYARELTQRGVRTVAVDLSEALLNTALQINGTRIKPWFVRADMRQLPLNAQFNLIISLFTSFGYFSDDDDHRRMLRIIADCLAPSGIFILDLPNKAHVVAQIQNEPVTTKRMDDLTVTEERWMDEPRVIKRIEIREGGRFREYFESVRLYDRDELKALAADAGLYLRWDCWGDYNGGELTQRSPRMIFFLSHHPSNVPL